MSKNILLISPISIKENTGVAGNIDEKNLYPEIKTCQDMYILPALGSALYDRLQTGIQLGNLTTDEQNLINLYIKDCLIYYVLSELPMGLNYQFYTKGAVQKTGENTTQPSMQELIDISDRYKARAEFYKERMIKYLRQVTSNSGLFPQYLNPGSGVDTLVPERSGYTISIVLDEDCNCSGKTFEEKYQGVTGRNCGC